MLIAWSASPRPAGATTVGEQPERPTHPMGASIVLIGAVTVLLLALALTSAM